MAPRRLPHAILLHGIEEAEDRHSKFNLSARLTSHVRHKAKYLDVQLLTEQGFIFTKKGKVMGGAARTLKEFVQLLGSLPDDVTEGHALRGDFSRWLADVFRDHALVSEARKLEKRFRLGHTLALSESLAQMIGGRYELSTENIP